MRFFPTKVSPFVLLGFVLFLSAVIVSYWSALVDLVDRWNGYEEYGYGYFIPLISAFLIYKQKQQMLSTDFEPSWFGVAMMLLAVVFFILGEIATTYTLVQYSFVLILIGFALALLGWKAFKVVIAPLALLFFMVPFPPFILNTLSGHLQLISSQIGEWFITLFGIAVFVEGNVIDLGNYQLQVVEACSGLNYLFPLLSISFIMPYLFRVEFWKRTVVFLSSIPITVLMNSFRIGVIGWLVNHWGIEQAEGFLHYFEGWVIFMACLGILLFLMTFLSRVGDRPRRLSEVLNLHWPVALQKDLDYPKRRVSAVHYGMVGVVAILLAGSLYVRGQEEVHQPRSQFSSFPQQIGDWIGRESKLETIYLDSLKLDDYYFSNYRNPTGDQVHFYAAYYASQQAGSAAHSPRSCIPGGGWQIEEVTRVDLPGLEVQGQPLAVNRLVIKQGEHRQLVYYWFQQRGRVITNEYLVKWYLFLDGLMRQRTDGALVRLTTTISLDEDWSDGDRRLEAFAREVVPLLDEYVPD